MPVNRAYKTRVQAQINPELHAKAKAQAALRGIYLEEYFIEAIVEKLKKDGVKI